MICIPTTKQEQRHLQWCNSKQGSWKSLVRSQQFIWKTVKENMAETLASPSPKRPRYTGSSLFPPPLYGAETCILYRKQIRPLERSHQRCLHSILSIKWRDRMPNEEVLGRAILPSTQSVLLQVQLRWAGHVTRMEDVRMPKAVFFSELQEGKRYRDALRKRYKDQLKRLLIQVEISHPSWQQGASDRDSWRSSVRKAGCKFEAERHEAAKERRGRQKERASSQSSPAQPFVCPKCSRVCASRLGLYSHQRAWKNWSSTVPKILLCEESNIIIITQQKQHICRCIVLSMSACMWSKRCCWKQSIFMKTITVGMMMNGNESLTH